MTMARIFHLGHRFVTLQARGQMVLLLLATLSTEGYPQLERSVMLEEVFERILEGNY